MTEWYFAWWAYNHIWQDEYVPDYMERPTEEAALRSIKLQSQAAFLLRKVYYLDRKYA